MSEPLSAALCHVAPTRDAMVRLQAIGESAGQKTPAQVA
jgi:hypothetical protein